MDFDLNNAEQNKPRDTLIPHGTIVPVHLTLRPGGAGEGGWLKRSARDALMLDCEFTVIDGEHAKRKFWTYFTIGGETDGQKQAADISRSNIRAMLESARGINPGDADEKATAARRIRGFEDLDGLRLWCAVRVEKGTDGYKDKNQFSYAVTPDRKEWTQLQQDARPAGSAARPAQASAASAPRASAGRPAWAGQSARQEPPQAAAHADLNDKIPF